MDCVESIKAVWVSFETIIDTLQEIINLHNMDKNTLDYEFRTSKNLLSFEYLISLNVYYL